MSATADLEALQSCEVLLRRGELPGAVLLRRECGQRPAALHRSACACGHASERYACRECAALPGSCRRCRDGGHECPVTIAPASSPA